MSPVLRLLAPLSVAAALAAAPAALAAPPSVATFPAGGPVQTTVEMTDAGPSADTVRLTVTAADPADLAGTKVFLGGDGATPYTAVGVDGVRDARYARTADGELSTETCAVYDGDELVEGADVTAAGQSFSVDLPKGEVVSFESTGVAVGIVGRDADCERHGFHGLEVDYVTTHESIGAFSWAVPAAPVVTATGGRRTVTLAFDRRPGTSYDVFRAGEAEPVVANLRGSGDAVELVLDQLPEGTPLEPGKEYAFEVRATRLFNVWVGEDMEQLVGPRSAVVRATTAAVQTVAFTATPAATTSDQRATFAWTIGGLGAGETPWCLLDHSATAHGTEVPCTATGATLEGLTVGAHVLTVVTPDGESSAEHKWTVTAAAAAPVTTPPVVQPPAAAPGPAKPLVVDGIPVTWLVGGKPAPAPAKPKAKAAQGKVELKLGAAPKSAKKVNVYRKAKKGAYDKVATLPAKTKKFVDKKVKPGQIYTYKSVAVNGAGQQGAASKPATVRTPKKAVKKQPKG